MSHPSPRRLASLAVAALLLLSAGARADGGDTQRFHPSATPYSGFGASVGDLLLPGDWVVGLTLDYTHNPLLYRLNDSRTYATIQNNLTANLTVALGLWERFELDVDAPLVLVQNGNDPRFSLPHQATSDFWIHPKVQLLQQGRDGFNLTISPDLIIPVSRQLDFNSEATFRLYPELGASWRGQRWFFAGDLIFLWRGPKTDLVRLSALGNELSLDVSAGRLLSPDWEMIGELVGGVALATVGAGTIGNPLEGMLGLRYHLGDQWTFQLGAGGGILAAPGTPDFRAVLGVFFGPGRPRPPDYCIRHTNKGDRSLRKLGIDTDGDGIDDACDSCPYAASSEPDGCPLPAVCPAAPPPEPVRFVAPPAPPPAAPPTQKRTIIIKPIQFEFDKDVIRRESLADIAQVVEVFKTMPPDMHCQVVGHTDKKGRRAYNVDLSSRRAAAVVREMVRLGVEPSRLDSAGKGYNEPIAPNDTDENRQKNRRVEFIFAVPESGAPPALTSQSGATAAISAPASSAPATSAPATSAATTTPAAPAPVKVIKSSPAAPAKGASDGAAAPKAAEKPKADVRGTEELKALSKSSERGVGEHGPKARASDAPAVAKGEPVLSQQVISDKLAESKGAYQTCISEALHREPGMRVGKIHITATIAPSGQVTNAKLDKPPLEVTQFGACLKKATRRIVFPSFEGEPFDADIPLVVTAAE